MGVYFDGDGTKNVNGKKKICSQLKIPYNQIEKLKISGDELEKIYKTYRRKTEILYPNNFLIDNEELHMKAQRMQREYMIEFNKNQINEWRDNMDHDIWYQLKSACIKYIYNRRTYEANKGGETIHYTP